MILMLLLVLLLLLLLVQMGVHLRTLANRSASNIALSMIRRPIMRYRRTRKHDE
jgi:hypothetical protein